ncbi:DEAD/DEAH box helicase family protein [Agromyces sp. ISL-38]|uniref:DEAD/DEAH box helicase family protein n=1 Tax=Agromyces sp. ISL-38 TaxID=2819107 RepID=UPI001BE84E89|nr:DEAD/DEAH box helicase family protein [Agromyces sp. ISL-38]MBT2499233.1 DEAD/DEAH box helicase family protein [Agromyces sp. ISL-38]
MTNFDFVQTEWPEIAAEARRAEFYVNGDPRSSLFYARRTVELSVLWLYRADAALREPYKDDLASRLHEPTFKRLVSPAVLAKMNLIRKRGNDAVHKTYAIAPGDSLPIIRELFHVLIWFATHYATDAASRPAPGRPFDAASLPKPQPGIIAKTKAQLAAALAENEQKDAALAEMERESDELHAEIEALRAEVAAAKAQNALVPDTHDYDEEATRDRFIDVLLREAGWNPSDPHTTEVAVTGLVGSPSGAGAVDYVLWGDDGKPLGLVEAKRTKRDARVGQQQAKLYADALELQYGQRPVIFTSNGYEQWIWDDLRYPPREVQGFYTKDELALLVQRRHSRHPLASLAINEEIASRTYQHQAIRAVAEAYEHDHERRSLLIMATGSGKTRTVIALVDLLARANWVKRVLFLADRVALVNQATNAFKQQLPDLPPVNLVTEKARDARVYVSTYPTMMGLIDQGDELRRFGPGYFDLIVIDEAHRSVYQKYGAIFEYFDALVVGLTATPKDEVDHNTYRLFNLEDGVPTYSYDLGTAIDDGYLVPPVARSITSKFLRSGIRYDDLSEDQKEQWDLLEWEDGLVPDRVEAEEINKWLFNEDTVDKVLEVLMTEGRTVAGGDRLGKTIVFAKNNDHAQFIAERFDANYPEYAGHFTRVITYRVERAQTLIDDFSQAEKSPHIAISVDMLDTGIDVPEVVNLVFFKAVYSKSKYWQMLGRGTRLRPDLYGSGDDKLDFVVFDVGGNIEFFNQQLPELQTSNTRSLHSRLFTTRLDLLRAIDRADAAGDASDADREVRTSLAERLQAVVAGMNEQNFLVRRYRRLVEHFGSGDAWQARTDELSDAAALADLPSAALTAENDERAKRFDLLVLRAQLGVVAADPGFAAARDRIRAIAAALGEQRGIPVVTEHLELIDAVAGVDWWQDVTLPLLELMRTRLRPLVRLIELTPRSPMFTDFEDELEMPDGASITIVTPGVDRTRFRDKLFAYLRRHETHLVLRKLRTGKQLTETDLDELQRLLVESGELEASDLDAAVAEADDLGLFVRSIVGLERSAAQEALSVFVADRNLTSRQISFVDLIVTELSRTGSVPIRVLYDPPFDAIAPTGPEDVFTEAEIIELEQVLDAVAATARPVRTA